MITTKYRFRPFAVKFIGPTSSRPSRVKVTDMHNKKSVIFSRNSVKVTAYMEEEAKTFLRQRGIRIHGEAIADNDTILLSRDFTTPIK